MTDTGRMKVRWEDLVVATPGVMNGEARIAGTRISVHTVLACLAEGWDETRIHREYPTLPAGAVNAAAGFSAWYFSEHALEVAAPLAPAPIPQVG